MLKALCIFFLFFLSTFLEAQVIGKIEVLGNKKTRTEVITREMRLKVGSIADSASIELDRRKIESLGLFDKVDATFRDSTLKITVDERWYIWPVPEVFNAENSFTFSKFKNIFTSWNGLAEEKVTLKLSLKHTNFRGNNEKLSASVSLGYNAGYELFYLVPWLTDKKLILQTMLFRRTLEVESEFDNSWQPLNLSSLKTLEQGGFLTLGRQIGFDHKIFAGVGYRNIQSQKDEPIKNIFLSPKENDKLPSLLLSYIFDTRDLIFYPNKGIYFESTFQRIGLTSTTANYWKSFVDARYFFPISKHQILGFHVLSQNSKGKVPVYDRYVLGSIYTVRGHFRDQRDGEQLFLTSIAYRFPILKTKHYKVQSFDFSEDYTDNFKFGVSGELFFDSGDAWYKDSQKPNSFSDLQKGFGFGLNFHIPYREVIRTEFAFDEKFKFEFLLGIFVSF